MLVIIAVLPALIGSASGVFALRAQTRGMTPAPYYAVTAVSFAVSSVLSTLGGSLFNGYFGAAVSALNAYLWWHNGGGDGTRRRLKSWSSRFHGVRRTAPNPT